MEEEQKDGQTLTSSSSVNNGGDATTVPPSSETAETAREPAASGSSSVVTSKLTGLKRKLPSASAAAAATGSKRGGTEPAVSLFDAALPPSSPAVELYRSCLLSHFFPSSSSYPPSALSSLPGPQPASLTRAELHKLESGQYWVCEKSDGERCILLLHSASRTVALLDRRWSCRVMRRDCGELLIGLLAAKGDTVLDAELLEDEEGKAGGGDGAPPPCRISLFDVLAVNGERVADRLFSGVWSSAQPPVSDGSGRLDVLHNAVQAPYRDWMLKAKAASPPPAAVLLLERCLELHVKEFEPKHRVESVLGRISHSAPAASSSPFSHHLYGFKGRSNSNDGLIFTPDADSYYARSTPLLKWKWPDLNTVDFLISQPFTAAGDRGLPLLCKGHVKDGRGGAGGGLQVQDIVFDYIRQLDDTGSAALAEVRRRGCTSAVVECGYSSADSEWHIKCVRWDKSNSNFLTTVVATMKACIDDLQSTDIVQACKKNKLQVRRG